MYRRRWLLLMGGTLSAATAGCLGDDDDDGDEPEDVDDTDDDDDTDEDADTDGDDDTGEGPDEEPAEFTVDVTSSNSPVQEGAQLDVTATVTNEGEATEQQTLSLSLSPDLGEVATETVALSGGESETVTISWGTEANDAGEYTAQVESDDDQDTIDVVIEEVIDADTTIDVVSNEFDPDLVNIEEDETVLWSGVDGSHTVTFYHEDNGVQQRVPEAVDAFDQDIGSDDEAFYTFEEPGVYDYFCDPHEGQGMVGTVVVGENDDPDQPGLTDPGEEIPDGAAEQLQSLNDQARDLLGIEVVEEDVEITVDAEEFEPDIVEVSPGSEVTWQAEDGPHTVTFYHEDVPVDDREEAEGEAEDEESPFEHRAGDEEAEIEPTPLQHRVPDGVEVVDETLDAGEQFSLVLDTPGVYDYVCGFHEQEGMVGSLVVGENADPDQPGLAEPDETIPDEAATQLAALRTEAISMLNIPTVEEAVEYANDVIETVNEDPEGSLVRINDILANVEDIETVSKVEATTREEAQSDAQELRSEADRLVEEIIAKVPEEIEIQAEEEDLPSPIDRDAIDTTQDMRDEADDIPRVGELAQDAIDALHDAADIAEWIEQVLHEVADELDASIEL